MPHHRADRHIEHGLVMREQLEHARMASAAALLSSVIILVGCTGPVQLFVENPIAIDHLEGNYKRLASCTYEQLARRQGGLLLTDLRERSRIAHTNGPETQWELLFINEDGGRQTRLEVTSTHGSFPSEHALALARACAA